MTNKCQILDCPIKTNVAHKYHLIICISRLHNYVINEGEIVTPMSSEVQVETCYTSETNICDEIEIQKNIVPNVIICVIRFLIIT